MIPVSSDLAKAIRAGGFQKRFVADVVVDGTRVLEAVKLPSCELRADGTAKVRTQGTTMFHYTSALGRSIVPEDVTSWLTPFATFLNLSYEIKVDRFTERVLMGTLKVVEVADPVDRRVSFLGRRISLGSKVKLTFADLFSTTDRERFPAPYAPTSLASTWTEIGVLTGLPLTRNVPDAAIPTSVTYEENRLDGVMALGRLLGGVPYVNPLGQVQIDPDTWPAPTEEIRDFVTLPQPATLNDQGVYNQVIVRTDDAASKIILDDTVKVEQGPLRYGGPFGRVPYFASSRFVTTKAQANDYARSLLPKVSSVPALTYTLQITPDPRREVGDVVPFWVDEQWVLGRIVGLRLSSAGSMELKVVFATT